MAKRHAPRYSPTFFKRKATAIAFFVLVTAVFVVGGYISLGMLTRFDYEAALPEDATLRVRLADGTYITPTRAPTPEPVVTATPLPTPIPTPEATQVPLAYFCAQDTRMIMPSATSLPGEVELTRMYVSQPDNAKAVVLTGWGFLKGYDAQKTRTHLVVSGKASDVVRFYEVTTLPGSSGVVHDANLGENLERADFRAVFSVMTYEEGWYKIGLLIGAQSGKSTRYGYFEFPNEYLFYVSDNAVTRVGG